MKNTFLNKVLITILLCFLFTKTNSQTHTFQENLELHGSSTPTGFFEFFIDIEDNWLSNVKPSGIVSGFAPFYIGNADDVKITGVNCSTSSCLSNHLRGANCSTANLEIRSNGKLTIGQFGQLRRFSHLDVLTNGELINEGIITTRNAGHNFTIQNGGSFSNSATGIIHIIINDSFVIGTGAIITQLAGTLNLQGEWRIHSGVILPNTITVTSNGTIKSAGTFQNNFTLSGFQKLEIGVNTIGTATFNQNLNLSNNNTSKFQINSLSSFDKLTIGGTLNLGSSDIEVTLGFTPKAGDRFKLITHNGFTGNFGTLNLPNTHTWNVEYNANDITLEVIGCTATDNLAPTMQPVANQAAYLHPNNSFTIPDYTGLVQVSDNCDTNPTITQSPVAGTIINTETTTNITITATDASTNSSQTSFNLTTQNISSSNQTLTGSATINSAQDNTLSLQSSETGFNYFLQNTTNNTLIGNSQAGTGNTLNFQTDVVSETTNYNVFAANPSYALDFDGVDDYVEIPHNSNQTFTNGITIDTWVKPTNQILNQNWSDIYRKENDADGTSQGRIMLIFDNSDSDNANILLRFGIETTVNGFKESFKQLVPADIIDKWTHILAFYDNNTNAMRLYVNGIEVDSTAADGTIVNPPAHRATVASIGNYLHRTIGPEEHFKGQIASLRIWDKALTTQAEINKAKNNLFIGDETNLVAYYPFLENMGTQLTDLTTNANNGTINGANWSSGTDGGVGKVVSNTQTITYDPQPQTPTTQTLIGAATIACPQDNTLTLQSSETNFNYFLRNDITKEVIGSSQVGTASALNFQTGVVSETTNYHVFAANPSYALDFDGVNDYVEVPHDNSLNFSTGMTIEAWIHPTNITNGYQEIFRKDNFGNGRILLSFQENGTILSLGTHTTTDGYTELDVSINPVDYNNQWVHVLAFFDDVTNAMRIYRNGVEIGSKASNGNIITPPNPQAGFIGSINGTGEFFQGKIASLRVWNKALTTQTEINQAKDNLFVGDETNLVAYYPFFENAGTQLTDSSANTNNGTISGATWSSGTTGGIGKIASNTQAITFNDPAIVYVDAAATGNNNGCDWANAFTNIQDAVNAVAINGQILIAAGTYQQGSEITINKAMIIKGGYPTGGGTQDIATHKTILDGENSYRVLKYTGTGGLTLQGVTIQNGNTTEINGGAGIHSATQGSTVFLSDSKIIKNTATGFGGGIFSNSFLNFTDCVIANNSANEGGGIYSLRDIVFNSLSIVKNTATTNAGGIRHILTANVSIQNTILALNTAPSNPQTDIAAGSVRIYSYNYYQGQNLGGSGSIHNTSASFAQFVDAANNNFNLQNTSPLVNAGSPPNRGGTDVDANGNVRTIFCSIDIGALENTFQRPAGTIYVDKTATGANNGTSWANAFTTIAAAINFNGTCIEGDTILIAAGTYQEGEYIIKAAKTIKGGYPTGGGLQDIANNLTILDGSNAHRVLRATHTTGTLHIEGITIQKGELSGNAFDDGAGIHTTGNITFNFVKVINNIIATANANASASSRGGGIFGNSGVTLTIANSIVSNNSISSSSSATTFGLTESLGGGIHIQSNSSITLNNSIVNNNTATSVITSSADAISRGGGIYGGGSNSITLLNSEVNNNTLSSSGSNSSFSVSGGGGMYSRVGSTITLTNSLMINNAISNSSSISSRTRGGGMLAQNASTVLQNSIVWGNTKTIAGNTTFNEVESSQLTTNYSLIKGLDLSATNGINDSSNMFNPLFIDEANGDYRLQNGSPLINVGNNSYNTTLADLDGNARFVGTIDIGAYEFNGAANANTSWTGATNTLWQEAGNWNNGVPTATSNVTIPTGLGNYPTVTNLNNATAFNVDNKTGASVIVNAGKGLTIGNNLTNNGTITVHSDATSSGALVVKGEASGNITYNRYVTDNWHTVGAPVIGQTIQTVAENNQVIQNGDNTKYAIAPYNNDIPSSNWEYILVADVANVGNFTNGKGYSMKRALAGTYSFTGNIENNNKTVTLTEGSKNNWNLIANPYPSFLKFNNLADASSNLLLQNVAELNPSNLAIYIWDTTTSGYKPYNHASTNLQYLAPGQAFFVNAKTGGSSFTFYKSMQTHYTGAVFAKNANSIFEMSLQISDGKKTKSTQIKYLKNTTKGLDMGYDAAQFSAENNSFSIFTELLENNENKAFALQCLPPTGFEEQIIPIGVNADANSSISFSVDAKNIPKGIHIYLEDKLENTFTKLNDDGNYEITLLEAQNGVGRFYVHTTSQVLSTDDVSSTLDISKIWVSDKRILTITNLSLEKATIALYDLLGKEVFTKQLLFLTQSRNLEIQLPNTLSKATYIVRLKAKNGVKTTKILIK